MPELRLSPELLERAYRNGYFPMADPKTNEIYWYRPDPRAILPLDGFHVSHSLKKRLRTMSWKITYNHAFLDVMKACGDRDEGTWMNEEFFRSYGTLHQKGKAHSVEVWDENKHLIGGVYGVALGAIFFAESMFHKKTDASKVALFYLVERLNQCRYRLLEVQFLTNHLKSLGAIEIADSQYMVALLGALQEKPAPFAGEQK